MSLQLAAQHLASRGRGPDTTLVHMAPQEVAGLQALARAHGGTLTVNPDTGLPEAGFLSSILPMIAGIALGPAGLGLTAMQAALATGAAGTLATGSLRKGLMAGLGAYGGAGIGGVISGAGESALQAAASSPATSAVAPVVRVAPAATAAASPVSSAAQLAGTTGTEAIVGATPGFQTLGGETLFGTKPVVTPISEIMQTATPTPTPNLAPVVDKSTYPVFERFKEGVGAIVDKPELLFNKENIKYGLAALAPMMTEEQKQPTYRGTGPNPYQYTYSPGRIADPIRTGGVGEYQYFAPSYTRMAAGGPVEAMSDRNAQETFLANGGQRFAEGGRSGVPQYDYDPRTQRFTEIAPITAAPVRTVTRMPGEYGGDIGPSSMPTPMGITGLNSNSITGGLIPAIVGYQDPTNVPVVDLSTNAQNVVAQQAAQAAAAQVAAEQAAAQAVANQAAQGAGNEGFVDQATGQQATQASGTPNAEGVVTGGPIGPSDVTGVDIGPVSDSAPGDGPGSAAAGSGSDDLARGGITALMGAFSRGGYSLGDYSDGGRLLRGPGDGVSDDIPATIADKRPARLADGEFVVPARIVSELGNGSTEAGARKLYAMMDRIQKARGKTVGKNKVAVNSRAEKLLPA